MRDPNWTGPGPGPFIDVAEAPAAPAAAVTVPARAAVMPTFADNPGQARIQAERGAAAAAATEAPVIVSNEIRAANPVVSPVITDAPADDGADTSLQDTFLAYIQGLEQQRANTAAAAAAAENQRLKNDARQVVRNALDSYRLPATLGTFIYDLITQDQIDLNSPDSILYAMRQRPEYQERFKANAQRVKNGLSELDPSTYLALETDFKQVMRANGLPPGFYDDDDDLAALIAGDTSPSEVQRRIEDGYNAVQLADPQVKAQMYNLYGVDDSQLVAYYLDPTRGESLLRRQTRAAQISAESKNLANIQLTTDQAQQLADAGVTQKEAQKGFAELGQMSELIQSFGGEAALNPQDVVAGKFGTNTEAQKELARRAKLRTAEFAGGGSFARTTGETSGSVTTSVGRAQ